MLASPTVVVVERQPVTGRLLLLHDKNGNERAKDALVFVTEKRYNNRVQKML